MSGAPDMWSDVLDKVNRAGTPATTFVSRELPDGFTETFRLNGYLSDNEAIEQARAHFDAVFREAQDWLDAIDSRRVAVHRIKHR